MKVFGDAGMEILFPKCEYVAKIEDAQIVYLVTYDQYAVKVKLNREGYDIVFDDQRRPHVIPTSLQGNQILFNDAIDNRLKEIVSQMNKNQLLIVCGGFTGAYAKMQGLTVGITSRSDLTSYMVHVNGYVYNVVGNQASVILAKVDKTVSVLGKSPRHVANYLVGMSTETLYKYGEAEMLYFKYEDKPSCLAFQFFPSFYPKATIIPKLVSRIKKYI